MILERVPTTHEWQDGVAALVVLNDLDAVTALIRRYHGQVWDTMPELERAGLDFYFRSDYDQSAYLNTNWPMLLGYLRHVTSAMRRFL